MKRHFFVLARLLGAVLLANACFLALSLATRVDTQTVVNRVQTAFAAGELGDIDYLAWDSRRGWHQYNDCLLLQLLSNENPSRLQRALAPTVYSPREEVRSSSNCAFLRALTIEAVDRDTLVRGQYARYWHGSRVPVALALRSLELVQVRVLLSIAVWLAVAILAFAAYKSGPLTQLTGLSIALVSATVWALPYFAPGLTHGPGDAALLLGLAVVIAWPRLAIDFRGIVSYAATFGCVIAFFDMLTGQLPIAAGWLVALTLSVNRDQKQATVVDGRIAALAAVAAFGVGAGATVLIKQALAMGLIEPGTIDQFASNLRFYVSMPDYEKGWPGFLEPFGRLVNKSGNLTYGKPVAGYVLVIATVFIWLVAAIRSWRTCDDDHRRDTLTFLGAALIPAAWVLILPNHTYIHAAFMVRILVVPIALAPVTLLWRTHRGMDRGRRA